MHVQELLELSWQEDIAEVFLGARMKHNESGLQETKQNGLINHLVKAIGLDVGTVTAKVMLVQSKPFVKDTKKEVAH